VFQGMVLNLAEISQKIKCFEKIDAGLFEVVFFQKTLFSMNKTVFARPSLPEKAKVNTGIYTDVLEFTK